jgi:hypothetical protein
MAQGHIPEDLNHLQGNFVRKENLSSFFKMHYFVTFSVFQSLELNIVEFFLSYIPFGVRVAFYFIYGKTDFYLVCYLQLDSLRV